MHGILRLLLVIIIIASCKPANTNNSESTQPTLIQDSLNENYKPLTKGTFSDSRDNKSYKWVKLRDGKTWMAENLNYESNESWCFTGKQENCDKWGRLYSFNAALNACPEGWHLPSQAEWTDLFVRYGKPEQLYNDNLGLKASQRVFQLFKESGEAEFNLLNCGLRVYDGYMTNDKDLITGYYWSSTKVDEEHASYYMFNSESLRISRWNSFDIKTSAFACRCVKNTE